MKNPGAEWLAIIAAPIVVDAIRARGEADGDTVSEILRDAVGRHPLGRYLFAGGLAVFYVHIVRPLNPRERKRYALRALARYSSVNARPVVLHALSIRRSADGPDHAQGHRDVRARRGVVDPPQRGWRLWN